MDRVEEFEHELGAYLHHKLSQVDGVQIYGPPPNEDGTGRAALCAFNVDGIHPSGKARLPRPLPIPSCPPGAPTQRAYAPTVPPPLTASSPPAASMARACACAPDAACMCMCAGMCVCVCVRVQTWRRC